MEYESLTRLAVFAGVFAAIAIWERWAPRRVPGFPRRTRWVANLGLIGLGTVLLRLVMPAAAVGVALFAAENDWGLLNQYPVPAWVAVGISVVLLDMAIYLQHVMFHAVPLLWRLHLVHHTDLDYDLTTGVRFHPLEILLSISIKACVVLLLGAPVAAVIIFEILLNATAMFNHGNIRLPPAWDRRLRRFLVTPDMHRVHHSTVPRETNSNFGFNLSIWDRIFGTYREQPAAGHEAMEIGLPTYRFPQELSLGRLLLLPFTANDAARRTSLDENFPSGTSN